MGLIAEYLLVDEPTLDSLVALRGEALTARVLRLAESPRAQRLDIGKLWDALHYLLTGRPASQPLAGHPLSEAVVGVHTFEQDADDADFIACIEHNELPGIVTALAAADAGQLAAGFDPAAPAVAGLYPAGIGQGEPARLVAELRQALAELLAFYQKAQALNQHVLVSIL